MIGCSKKNKENYPRKSVLLNNNNKKETQVKIQPWVSANQPSNN